MTCLGCGAPLAKRHQRVFCSNRCQREVERAANVGAWLATGTAIPGTNRGHYVRNYLYKAQQARCAICDLPDEWNGARLALVLDHVDGDATNNARPNLRLICPNCDSQLSTYKSRNKGRGRASRRQRYADGKSY